MCEKTHLALYWRSVLYFSVALLLRRLLLRVVHIFHVECCGCVTKYDDDTTQFLRATICVTNLLRNFARNCARVFKKSLGSRAHVLAFDVSVRFFVCMCVYTLLVFCVRMGSFVGV